MTAAELDLLLPLIHDRMTETVLRDLALSQRLADSEVTRRWLLDENDPQKKALFFDESTQTISAGSPASICSKRFSRLVPLPERSTARPLTRKTVSMLAATICSTWR